MRNLAQLGTLFAAIAVGGCSLSHNGTPGEPCGPVTCADDEVCCNASCGICTAPGEACAAIACLPEPDAGTPRHDSGPGHDWCGEVHCALGVACCFDCDGRGFCSEGGCPDLECPPPPPECEACDAGQTCCPGCGDEPICVPAGSACPDVDCPAPPSCGECDGVCCPHCDGGEYCVEGETCPGGGACPPPCTSNDDCGAGSFCSRRTCGAPGVCLARPEGCARDCPGVCGCDGETYCNECNANAEGVSVAHAGACGADSCEGRDFCDCDGGCQPLVDLTPGCVCNCDDPFNCTGILCDCDCGGAEYRGCAPAGRCPETAVTCGDGCVAALVDGCLQCVCDG